MNAAEQATPYRTQLRRTSVIQAVLVARAHSTAFSLFVVLAISACQSEGEDSANAACGPNGACPSGFVCRASSVCYPAESTSTLSLTIVGPGSATVDGTAPCATGACSKVIPTGTLSYLVATPLSGATFASWGGNCSGTSPTITVVIDRARACTATFTASESLDLAVQAQIGGSVSNDAGLDCSMGACTGSLGDKSTLTLTAAPASGHRFTGWTGDGDCDDASANPLVIHPDTTHTCTARFIALVTISGVGHGATVTITATSMSPDAVCAGSACTVDSGSTVLLTAESVSGYRQTGWSGAGCPTSGDSTIAVTATADTTCTAEYAPRIAVKGSVVGAIGSVIATSLSQYASCQGDDCSVERGADVTLTAPTIANARFLGWSGDPACTGANPTLVLLSVTQNVACTATFEATRVTVSAATSANVNATVTTTTTGAHAACAPGSCTFDAGTGDAILIAPPVASFAFVGWSGASVCTGASTTLIVHDVVASVACLASYTPARVAVTGLTAAAPAGAAITARATRADASCRGATCTVDAGSDTVTLTATTVPSYHVTWTGAAACAGTGDHVTVTNPTLAVTCTATYARDVVCSPGQRSCDNISALTCVDGQWSSQDLRTADWSQRYGIDGANPYQEYQPSTLTLLSDGNALMVGGMGSNGKIAGYAVHFDVTTGAKIWDRTAGEFLTTAAPSTRGAFACGYIEHGDESCSASRACGFCTEFDITGSRQATRVYTQSNLDFDTIDAIAPYQPDVYNAASRSTETNAYFDITMRRTSVNDTDSPTIAIHYDWQNELYDLRRDPSDRTYWGAGYLGMFSGSCVRSYIAHFDADTPSKTINSQVGPCVAASFPKSAYHTVLPLGGGDIIVIGKAEAGPNDTDATIERWTGFNAGQPPRRLWARTFGGTGYDAFYGGARLADDGYLLVGETSEKPSDAESRPSRAWVVRTDKDGAMIWSQTYGDPAIGLRANSVVRSANGHYVIGGNLFPATASTQTNSVGLLGAFAIPAVCPN